VTISDPGKMILFALVLVGSFVLIILNRSPEVGGGAILYVLGYLTGNGRLAASGRTPVPTIGTTNRHRRTDDQGAPDGP